MGFRRVYDYGTGKQNWLAWGLPTEGEKAGEPRIGATAREDVPTCGVDEGLGDVASRVRRAGWDACVVVNDHRVVLGLLREGELGGDPGRSIEEAMRPGPSTFRPHVGVLEMAAYMVEHDLVSCPVTTGDGELIGLLVRDDAVAAAREAHGRHHHDEGERG